ncbi:MAG: DUF6134 family protein [Alphaproteobacteria bacterium]
MKKFASLALAAAIFAWGVPAGAETPAGTYVYQINHSRYGEIGTHTITLSRNGASTIAAVKLRIQVKALFVTLHRVSAERTETWRGGKLVGYASTTKENGKLIKVTAREESGQLAIDSPSGKNTVALGVVPTNPWNIAIVKAKKVMDTKTGQIKNVLSVVASGQETITAQGKPVKATKYAFESDVKRELWYGPGGKLLQFRVFRDGNAVTFTLK